MTISTIFTYHRDSSASGAHSSEHQCDATAVSVIRGHFCIFSLSQFADSSTTRSFSCTFGCAKVLLFTVVQTDQYNAVFRISVFAI